MMRVLSAADRDFWEENGYVIVHDAVPQENLEAVIDTIWDFLEMDRSDPSTWYREPDRLNGMSELNKSGMVELYHHQTFWNNRQYPGVHAAFADILGTEKLWVTIDRVNLNRPARPGWDFQGFIHWDIDTSLRPLEARVQGVLSLNDTSAEQGGFQCVPGFPRRFEQWVGTQPAGRDPWRPDLTGLEIRRVETRAGDLLIWNSLTPHGVARNSSTRPRLAQYITMFPVQEENEELRRSRIRMWRERLTPEGFAFPGDPRELERRFGATAELTELGEKLLGLKSWS
jgi:ectoine hydroxylase-related dioxygenase (phytanoyl-CoA dioxygenase family)